MVIYIYDCVLTIVVILSLLSVGVLCLPPNRIYISVTMFYLNLFF